MRRMRLPWRGELRHAWDWYGHHTKTWLVLTPSPSVTCRHCRGIGWFMVASGSDPESPDFIDCECVEPMRVRIPKWVSPQPNRPCVCQSTDEPPF